MNKKCCSDTAVWSVTVKAPPPAVPLEYAVLGAVMLGGLILGGIAGMT